MKHLLIIFSLLLTSVSWSKDIDFNDLVKRDGLWYEKFTNEPFTGKTTGLKQGKVKDGKKDGLWETYYEDGKLSSNRNYKNGKRDGLWETYYEDGQLSRKFNYKNNKKKV